MYVQLVRIFLFAGMLGCVTTLGLSREPTTEEIETARNWVRTNFGPESQAFPFSFVLDGKDIFKYRYGGTPWPPDQFKAWAVDRVTQRLDECRTKQTITCMETKLNLQVKIVIVTYDDFPTVE
jgi:hypothetical protein